MLFSTLVVETGLNPHYAHVKLNDGREINVFQRDLARNPVADAANDTNLSSHSDDTENTILPQSGNESNSFLQPDITSNGRAAPDDTEHITKARHFIYIFSTVRRRKRVII